VGVDRHGRRTDLGGQVPHAERLEAVTFQKSQAAVDQSLTNVTHHCDLAITLLYMGKA
jgi:hypothetical protein